MIKFQQSQALTSHFERFWSIVQSLCNFFYFGPSRLWLKKNKVPNMMLVLPLMTLHSLTVLSNVPLNLIALWTSGNAKIRFKNTLWYGRKYLLFSIGKIVSCFELSNQCCQLSLFSTLQFFWPRGGNFLLPKLATLSVKKQCSQFIDTCLLRTFIEY